MVGAARSRSSQRTEPAGFAPAVTGSPRDAADASRTSPGPVVYDPFRDSEPGGMFPTHGSPEEPRNEMAGGHGLAELRGRATVPGGDRGLHALAEGAPHPPASLREPGRAPAAPRRAHRAHPQQRAHGATSVSSPCESPRRRSEGRRMTIWPVPLQSGCPLRARVASDERGRGLRILRDRASSSVRRGQRARCGTQAA